MVDEVNDILIRWHLQLTDNLKVALLEIGTAAENDTTKADIWNQLSREGDGRGTPIKSPMQDKSFNSIVNGILRADVIVLLFHGRPNDRRWPILLFRLAMNRCAELRSRRLYVVKNFTGDQPLLNRGELRRLQRMSNYIDWTDGRPHEIHLIGGNAASSQQSDSQPSEFSSCGEGFAWQLVEGFLSDVLPRFELEINEQLRLDESGHIPASKLRELEIPDVNPRKILVVKKYFMLLSTTLESSSSSPGAQSEAKHDDRYPAELYPGCKKIVKADGQEPQLTFKSDGYDKKLPFYLTKLEETHDGGYSHAVIFGGHAAPTFVIREMEGKSDEEKTQIFEDFKEELNYVLNHPKSGHLLCELSSNLPAEYQPTGLESMAIKLNEFQEENDLKRQIGEEIRKYLMEGQYVQQGQQEQHGPVLVRCSAFWNDQEQSILQSLHQNDPMISASADAEAWRSRNLSNYSRVLFVVHRTDLEQHSDRSLLRDMESAAIDMHRRGKFNTSVVVTGYSQADQPDHPYEDILPLLPQPLKHLPRSCVAVSRDEEQQQPTASSVSTIATAVLALGLSDAIVDDAEDTLPLMSLGPSMAANLNGFADFIKKFAEQERGAGQEHDPLLSVLPYIFVITESGRCPDESGLMRCFNHPTLSNEVEVGEKTFKFDGRPLSYKLYTWKGRKFAFEFPPSLRFIHKLAKFPMAGVSREYVSDNVEEFRASVTRCDTKRGNTAKASVLAVWDDTSFDEDTLERPTEELARSLLDFLMTVK